MISTQAKTQRIELRIGVFMNASYHILHAKHLCIDQAMAMALNNGFFVLCSRCTQIHIIKRVFVVLHCAMAHKNMASTASFRASRAIVPRVQARRVAQLRCAACKIGAWLIRIYIKVG